ncbi:RNA polymerase factor sigma-54 [Achromobacter insuavis]
MAEFVIDSLDEDGYLRTPLADLCGALSPDFTPPPEEDEWLTALRLVQQLDAPGLGARDLPECLILQLEAAPGINPPVRALALRIVREQIDRLAKNDAAGLRRALNCADDELRDACALIRSLDPKPGRRYDAQAPAYVVPDVFVDKWRSRWRVVPNRGAAARGARRTGRPVPAAARGSTTAARWRRSCRKRAGWSIERRYTTIQRVAEAIVKRQQTFFEYGEVALRPLMLKEVADDLDMHESTVSRATVGKYMVTPRGVFEFRHFFSRELQTDSGGTCSAAAVRALIKELIEAEDPTMPLSDVALAQQLARNGIVLARRTVSKYRGQLRLPPAELRREH